MHKHHLPKIKIFFILSFLTFLTLSTFGQKPKSKPIKVQKIVPPSKHKDLIPVPIDSFPKIARLTPIPIPAPAREVFANRGGCSLSGFYPSSVSVPPINLDKPQLIKARIIDWRGDPVILSNVYIKNKKDSVRVFTTNLSGYFTIDFPDTFKNMNIFLQLIEYEILSVNNQAYNKLFYIQHMDETYRNINLKHHYHANNGILIFTIASQNLKEKEAIVKDKFRFRDVKQINTRYTDIMVRF